MAGELHEDRRRAESFGDDALRYDRARPSYPNELVDDLTSHGPKLVLDVGCGTGIAGRLFSERGCRVLGVEADPRMAEVARSRGMDVEVATFESWEPRGRKFDLLVSGQAWHWIDTVLGTEKASTCIEAGGRFAAFWNHPKHRPEVMDVFRAAYADVAPRMLETSPALGGSGSLVREHSADPAITSLTENGSFDSVDRRAYPWTKTYLPEQWIDYVLSTSDHHLMDEASREELTQQLRARLASLGDRFEVDGATFVVSARRI